MTIKEQLLEAIREEPGITFIELVRQTGVVPGEVWALMSALRQEGKIKQNDRGWKVADRAQ
jgi:DNA-binding IclR family transcriptional regulator